MIPGLAGIALMVVALVDPAASPWLWAPAAVLMVWGHNSYLQTHKSKSN